MKLFSIPDAGRFLDLVEQSHGGVTLHLPDGNQLNLKQSHTAQQLFQIMHPGEAGLQISLSNPTDTAAFIRYMMEASVSN